MEIFLKRAYEPPVSQDGYRVLVDRLWPRGVSKKKLQVDAWLKDLGPSTDLRKWFSHEPTKWKQFERRYFTELDQYPDAIEHLLEKIATGRVTLVYAARDEKFNNAVALRDYLESHIATKASEMG